MKQPLQKCWLCSKAVGGCRWSRSLIPIKGWTAEECTVSKKTYADRFGYLITECPEFVEDSYNVYGIEIEWINCKPPKNKYFYEENATELIYAAVRQACDEYLASSMDSHKAQIIRELQEMDCYGVTDSTVVIAELKKIEGRLKRDH